MFRGQFPYLPSFVAAWSEHVIRFRTGLKKKITIIQIIDIVFETFTQHVCAVRTTAAIRRRR